MTNDYTYLLCHARDVIPRLLPQPAVVAELGVAEGEFSRQILDLGLPSQLHLVDPWQHQDLREYVRDPANVSNQQQETRYRDVQRRFAGEIRDQRVFLHRAYSIEAAARFPEHFFDWIYVDAMHTYEAVLGDLRAYADLVKPDGFICGHDYANHPSARAAGFGVVEAVNEFVEQTGYWFVALTDEAFPTYILAKNPCSAACRALERAILQKLRFVKIYDFRQRQFQQEVFVHRAGKPPKVYTTIR